MGIRGWIGTILCAGIGFAQAPAVSPGGILNHFSYALPGMPNAGIAQGSIFDIYGSNIGPATLAQASGFPLPTSLASTSVQVTVAGTTSDVLLFFVSTGQIAGLLPSRTPVGTGTLVVTVNGVRSATAPITVVARSIGILTLSQNGQGPAVMQVGSASGQVLLNSVTNSAQGGQVGVFYGTGLGAVTFDESRGAPFQNLDPPIQAFVDGQPAKVLFQGRVPGLAGLDQFNIEIPSGITGCYVTVWFQAGNIISNLTTISVAPGPACPDPIVSQGPMTGTLKSAGLQLVRGSQKIPVAGNNVEIVVDSGAAAFSAIDLSKIVPSNQVSPLTVIGGCVVGPIQNQVPGPDNGAVSYLDAGPVVTIKGPGGTRVMDKFPTGYALQLGTTPFPGTPAILPPPYLTPGVYTIDNGAGSASVPAFSTSITLPDPPFSWTNADQILSIQRTQGVEVTWSGGDSSGYVDIAGASRLPRSATQPVTSGGLFSCRVPANLGRFRITPQILLFLPPSVTTGGIPSAVISLINTKTEQFSLAGFDFAEFGFGSSISRSIEIR